MKPTVLCNAFRPSAASPQPAIIFVDTVRPSPALPHGAICLLDILTCEIASHTRPWQLPADTRFRQGGPKSRASPNRLKRFLWPPTLLFNRMRPEASSTLIS